MPRKTSPQTSYTTFFSLSPRILELEFVLETTDGTLGKKFPNWEVTGRDRGGSITRFSRTF